MSESTPPTEPVTGPVETSARATSSPTHTTPVVVDHRDVDERPRRSRLTTVAAWVGIVAGTVFVVAVVFFSGFVIGASVGGGHGHGGHHGRHGHGQMDDREGGGPRHGWQGGPGGFGPGFQGGPGYQGGPGFQGGPGGGGQGQGPGFVPPTPPGR